MDTKEHTHTGRPTGARKQRHDHIRDSGPLCDSVSLICSGRHVVRSLALAMIAQAMMRS